MKIPAITGVIQRRVLLNYRVSPEIVQSVLPTDFLPKLFKGYAIAGICLIRLEKIRPKGMPAIVGVSSENSAHRIAVEWDEDGKVNEGVFVPRRDTGSRLNAFTGGRIFPGVHHLSKFSVRDHEGQISIRVKADHTETALVDIALRETSQFPTESIFRSLEESSQFFENGCIGYSSRPKSCTLDGLKLSISNWKVAPLSVEYVRSAYFDNRSIFPEGSIEFDHALLMRDVPHDWHSVPTFTPSQLTENPSYTKMRKNVVE